MTVFKYQASFPISSSLHKKTKSSVKLIKENPEGDKSRNMLADVVNSLISESLDYYFLYSLKVIGLNMLVRKAITVVVSPFKTAVQATAKQIIKKMDDKQLIATVNFIDGFIS
ncbi:MAG: hypothetical protein JXR51_02540 [Bacteroidales bacterium]|nr:hypothetical protein [Bacteroidales bacterium]MBN2756026.1 hypothetical protein [Bacteroidales bacterium]